MTRDTCQQFVLASALFLLAASVYAAGDPQKGAEVYRVCAGCHTLEPGRHSSGPSLAHIYGRRAGTAEGFARYSGAFKQSKIVWDEKTLDAWIKKPAALIPDNLMPFPGIPDPQARADLIAFLKNAGAKGGTAGAPAGGMTGGMMQTPDLPNLKQLPAEKQVKAIRYCRDSYFVTVATGAVLPYWEFNLRLKTDSSANGPAKDKPVLAGAGMRGDRASIVFSNPAEISRFVQQRCE